MQPSSSNNRPLALTTRVISGASRISPFHPGTHALETPVERRPAARPVLGYGERGTAHCICRIGMDRVDPLDRLQEPAAGPRPVPYQSDHQRGSGQGSAIKTSCRPGPPAPTRSAVPPCRSGRPVGVVVHDVHVPIAQEWIVESHPRRVVASGPCARRASVKGRTAPPDRDMSVAGPTRCQTPS